MALATKKWSTMRFRRGVEAHDEWVVTGATTGNDALDATGVPHQNDSHPWDPFLLAQAPTITADGFNFYIVSVDYVRIGINGKPPDPSDPLSAPLRYRWEMGNTNEPIDIDNAPAFTLSTSNPLVNSAGERFDPSPTCEVGTMFLTVTRNEPFYPPGVAQAYQNRLNSDPFFGWDTGLVRCLSIAPEADYAAGANYVAIEYRFEFRDDGFKHRMVDQGYNGYYDDSGTKRMAPFYSKDGSRQSGPTLLNGKGKPLDSTIKVGQGLKDPVEFETPKGATVEGGSRMKFLTFLKFKKTSFSSLGLE